MSDSCSSSGHLTYAEWKSNRMNVLVSAELDRASAERLTSETKRFLDEIRQSSQEMDKISKWNMTRLKEEVRYWQTELNSKLEQIKQCIADLVSVDRRFDKSLDVIKENNHIVLKCIESQCKRKLVYLVYDPPAKSLCKEKETIQAVMAQFCKIKSEVNDQLRLLRKLRYDIEKDLLEKNSAWDLEMESEEIKRRRQEIESKTFDPHCEGQTVHAPKPRPLMNTDQWLAQAKKVFAEAERQRQNAVSLSNIAGATLQQGREELINIKMATDDTFKERINELRDHKYKMEDHLSKIVRQIQDVEALNQQLTDYIESFNRRVTYENALLNSGSAVCGGADSSNPAGVNSEHSKMADYAEKLKDNLACIHCSIQSLQRRKTEVENDLKLCNDNLLIDDYHCLPLRQTIKYFMY